MFSAEQVVFYPLNERAFNLYYQIELIKDSRLAGGHAGDPRWGRKENTYVWAKIFHKALE